MPELVRVPFQTGKCTRCGKQVTRGITSDRWIDLYGRDRCRASWEDDQCDVTVVHDEEQLAKLVTAEITTVTLGTANKILLTQDLMPGTNWSYDLIPDVPDVTEDPVTWITVTRREIQYQVEYVPGE